MSFQYEAHKIKKLIPLYDTVIVSDMSFDERISKSGIVIPIDDMKLSGIRPRWGKVYAIGPNQKDIKVGQYILVSHGRWTRGITIEDEDGSEITIRRVDTNDILLSAEEKPNDLYFAE